MNPAALALIGWLVAQRLLELAIAKRNTRRLLAQGAREHGASHYPLIVALHSAWLLSIALLGHDEPVRTGWLALFILLQLLRLWVLLTLGQRWTTRIIVLDKPLVRRGPFRFLRHPNYAVVVLEIFVAPMILGLTGVAIIFSLLNAAVLSIRLRAENRALAGLRQP